MKKMKKLLSAILACLLMTQGAWIAIAQDQTPVLEYHRLVYNDQTADGGFLPAYMVDEDGNRVDPPHVEKVSAAADNFPAQFDLRKDGVVTPVKNQGGAEDCWAFAATACMEISYIQQGLGTASNTDFSEAHLIWFGHRSRTSDRNDPTYGDGFGFANPYKNGGNWEEAASTIMRGSGMQLESKAPWTISYDANELMRKMSQPESSRYDSYARLWQAVQIPDAQLSMATIKSRIMQYGGVELYYYDNYNEGRKGFNSTYNSYYQTSKVGEFNHAVTVIGWNDAFPRTHFNTTAPSNGAWLVKGSWGTGFGDQGYYWLSYCDKSIMKCASFVTAPADLYDNIYQYDGAYPTGSFKLKGMAREANLFTAKKSELLTAVGVFSANQQTMRVIAKVYVDDGNFELKNHNPTNGMRCVEAATTEIHDLEYGYRTIQLNQMVPLKAGQKFTIEITYVEPDGGDFYLPTEGEGYQALNPNASIPEDKCTYGGEENQSFVYVVGQWEDTNKTKITGSADFKDYNNVPVKAMTKDLAQEPTLAIASLPYKTEYFEGETLDTNGLKLTYVDGTGAVSTVSTGFTYLPTTLSQIGEKQITVTYKGLQQTFTVQVRPVVFNLAEDAIQMRFAQKQQLSLEKAPNYMAVTWTSDDPNVASVSDTGLVCATGEGDTTVHCSAKFLNKVYEAACTVHVDDPKVLAIRPTNEEEVVRMRYFEGDSLEIPTVDVYYEDGSVLTFDDSFDYSPKTFETAGEQTAVDLTFGQWSDSFAVNVEKITISLDDQLTMYFGNSAKLKPTVFPGDLNVEWSSSNRRIVTVSQTGELKAKSVVGDATIKATITNGTKQKSAECIVHVEKQDIIDVKVKIAQTLYEGDALEIPVVDVIYSDDSMDTLEEGFDYNPKILQTAGDEVVVTVTIDDTDCPVKFKVHPLTLTLDQQKLDLRAGQTAQLSANTQPSGQNVVWTTSNASVAAVSAAGMVQAKAAGDATITATIINGPVQRSATCAVHVVQIPTLRIKTPSRTTLRYGESLTLHAETTNLPAGARILWTDGSNLTNQPGQNSDTCTVKAEKSGTVTMTVYLVDSAGNVIRNEVGDPVTAKQTITLRCGLLQKIGAFFRKLFGVRTHYPDISE